MAYFGKNFTSLWSVAHEIAHGIIESSAKLIYHDESGAINEAIADIFAVYSSYKILNETVLW